MTYIPPQTHDKFPDRLPIPQLTQLTAPSKMVFLAVHTKREIVSNRQYKRVLVSGFAVYWRREKKKSKEKREVFAFTNAYDFFDWLSSRVNKRETLYLYSHDVITDFLALDGFRQFPVQDFTLQSAYHRLTTTILKFAHDNRRVTVLDIQNYYPIKLDRLGKSFGVDIVPELAEGASNFDVDQWLREKAELLQDIVKGLISETVEAGRGSLRMTSGSTAQSIYRASYMKHKIITNHQPEVVEFERSSYVGGYTGLNKIIEPGAPDLYKVDVNSMYPSVMMEQEYPMQMIEFAPSMSLHSLERYLRGYLVIANVTLHARAGRYPYKHFESNIYPTGEFETTLSTGSLKRALANDEVKSVNRVAVYMGAPLFSDFVRDVYGRRMQARDEGNSANELLQKMVSNTLYGKFGQLQTESVRVGDAPIDEFTIMDAFDPASGTNWTEMHAGGSILFVYKKNETRYTSFAIASHITDYARVKLFSLIDQAGIDNVYYSDTDSLIVNKDGLHSLYPHINQSALGLLKLEEVAPWFVGFAKKDYIFGDTRKLKGFDAQGKRIDENVFEVMQRSGLHNAMQRKIGEGVYWQTVNKFYNPFIVSETLCDDGRVRPLSLPGDIERLGVKTYTMKTVKRLAEKMLPWRTTGELRSWLNI